MSSDTSRLDSWQADAAEQRRLETSIAAERVAEADADIKIASPACQGRGWWLHPGVLYDTLEPCDTCATTGRFFPARPQGTADNIRDAAF